MVLRPTMYTFFPYTTLFRSSFRMSWGYGAPGLGLGRIASLQFIDEPAIREEISIALQTTISAAFGYDHYVYRAIEIDRKSTRLNQSHSDLVCRLLLEKKKDL